MTIAGKAFFFARVREGSVCPFDYSFLNRHNELYNWNGFGVRIIQ